MGIATVLSPQPESHNLVSLKHRGCSSATSDLLNTAFYNDTTDSEFEPELENKCNLLDETVDIFRLEHPFLIGVFFPIFLNILVAILISTIVYFSGFSDFFNYTVFSLTKHLFYPVNI